jgi:hypothetical protein
MSQTALPLTAAPDDKRRNADRFLGTCHLCRCQTQVRQVEIYHIGSEGLIICEPCDREVADAVRAIANRKVEERKQAYLAKRMEASCKPSSP